MPPASRAVTFWRKKRRAGFKIHSGCYQTLPDVAARHTLPARQGILSTALQIKHQGEKLCL
ncbi:protein of unknown function [Serratia sp. Tan611]|nr:protein of unknown function [Serratia sp. Tan611]